MRLIVLALLVASARLSASAIIVFRTPTAIVLAADSLRVGTDGQTRLVCKIHRSGRWWLVFGGFFSTTDPIQPLDVIELTNREIATASTLRDVRMALEARVAPPIIATLTAAKGLPNFSTLFPPGAVSAIVVGGQNPGDRTLRLGVFRINLAANVFRLTNTWVECPGPSCGNGIVTYSASVPGPARAKMRGPLLWWVALRNGAAARRLIEEQITATPMQVSRPIDVLEITTKGPRWMQPDRESLCAGQTSNL